MVNVPSKQTRFPPLHTPATKLTTEEIKPDIDLADLSFSRTALVLPKKLGIDSWGAFGRRLGTFETGYQWWCGDYWHYGSHTYGKKKARAKLKRVLPVRLH